MEEFSESQAYKHLLSVAESIIDNLNTDPHIVQKYRTLKSAVFNKVTTDPLSQQLAYSKKLLNTYKFITSSLLQAISEFENEVQSSMERSRYNSKVIKVVKQWESRLQQARSSSDNLSQKAKLIAKQQISALGYYCAQLDGKLENMGLLIQVHKKMHDIIQQAAKGESQRTRRQDALNQNINDLQRQVGNVREARSFIEQYQITQKKHKQFKMLSSKLEGLLFENHKF